MKKSFLALLILLTVISCGKKRKVIEYGTESWPQDSIEFLTELYTEDDSAFYTYKNKQTGHLFLFEKAASLQALKDSTKTRIYYYYNSGKLHRVDHFVQKKPDGEAQSFYESGKKKSKAYFSNGISGNYESWYESGKLKIKGELLSDSTFRHREYFENGTLLKEMVSDKTGKGSCTSYWCTGKIHETGPIFDFNPCGIWKIYDTAGNIKQDTVFGIK